MTEPPIARITAEIRARYWDLPARIEQRRRYAHNTYMRAYMREVYRPARRRVDVTLTPAQYADLEQAAHAAGRKVTVFLREAAFAYLERRYLVPTDTEQGLHAVTRQLRAAGNNLNQLAHQANTQRRATAEDLRQARELLNTMEAAVTRFVRCPPPLSTPG
jgi:hypothetical protein